MKPLYLVRLAVISFLLLLLSACTSSSTPQEQHLLSVVISGTGSVVSDPAGISCGTACSASFTEGTMVTLTATPTARPALLASSLDWSGCNNVSDDRCIVSMTENKTVTATFINDPTVSLRVIPATKTFTVGDPAFSFMAELEASNEAISWALDGAGSIPANSSGTSVSYSPPSTGAEASAVLTASAGELRASATISIQAATAEPSLTVSPTERNFTVGDPAFVFEATLRNADDEISWTLGGAGSIPDNATGRTVSYTPPASGGNDSARLTATAGDMSASADISIRAQDTGGTLTPIVDIDPVTPVAGISDGNAVFELEPLARPALNTAVRDPVFGATIRRVGDMAEPFNGSSGNIYSQLQAFSADQLYMLLIEDNNGTTFMRVRRVSDLELIRELPVFGVPRWHPRQAHTIVMYREVAARPAPEIIFYDPVSDTTESVMTLPGRFEGILGTPSNEELSHDGRWLAGMAFAGPDDIIFTADLENKIVGTEITLADLPCPEQGEVDWVGMSPLGNYLVVVWTLDQPVDSVERCSGIETYDPTTGAFQGFLHETAPHGDLGLLADGSTEVFVGFELGHPSGDGSIAYRVLPGGRDSIAEPRYVNSFVFGLADHISCQGPAGVCLVTMYGNPDSPDSPTPWSTLQGELYLQYLDDGENSAVRRLTHNRSSGCNFFTQPKASLSRNGQYVIYTSDWSVGTGSESCDASNDFFGNGEAFVIDVTIP